MVNRKEYFTPSRAQKCFLLNLIEPKKKEKINE